MRPIPQEIKGRKLISCAGRPVIRFFLLTCPFLKRGKPGQGYRYCSLTYLMMAKLEVWSSDSDGSGSLGSSF